MKIFSVYTEFIKKRKRKESESQDTKVSLLRDDKNPSSIGSYLRLDS